MPPTQLTQADSPVDSAYKPALQLAHDLAAPLAETVPTAQLEQVAAPAVANVPAEQPIQTLAAVPPVTEPAVPEGQSEQIDTPVKTLYVPREQLIQLALEVSAV